MEFESLPTTPTAEELVDQAFSRAARAGRAKQGVEAQESMLQTASNVLSDNLANVVRAWPDFDVVDPFYRELAEAVLASTDDFLAEDHPDVVSRLTALHDAWLKEVWDGA